jgi:hypothetical protein
LTCQTWPTSISHFRKTIYLHCNGRITKIHTKDKAHSNQISSFLQSSKYTVQQVRWYQAQVHINQEATCCHIHKTSWCWQLFHFTQDAKWMVIISITLCFQRSVRMQAVAAIQVFIFGFKLL